MLTKGFTGPFKARPGPTGAAEVIRMEDEAAYGHLTIAAFHDLTDVGGPSAMELASRYAELLNEGHEVGHGASSTTPPGEEQR